MGWKVWTVCLAQIFAHPHHRNAWPIVDPQGRIYAHLAGHPHSKTYTEVIQRANEALRKVAGEMRFHANQEKSRRGIFPTVNIGMSSGSGNLVGLCTPTVQAVTRESDLTFSPICSVCTQIRLEYWSHRWIAQTCNVFRALSIVG